ncbi:hypothetical protein CDAR_497911 [Caerostris darwini]|uniref:Uncharacterized protein n=1 Tax=Caerostris darwini TaxID=1538125 RepID=A0AAV4THF8_9ARAC|nr:hypothetical protein CDAR_497911 [Caerostris darwini]
MGSQPLFARDRTFVIRENSFAIPSHTPPSNTIVVNGMQTSNLQFENWREKGILNSFIEPENCGSFKVYANRYRNSSNSKKHRGSKTF